MFRTLAAAVLSAALALPALADEVWALPSGNHVTYLVDEGDTAVLGYTPVVGLEQAFIFVPGLGGNYDNRGTFMGYWVEPAYVGPACPAALVASGGVVWERWGIVELKFQKKGFPSKIAMKRGDCFAAPTEKITLTPVAGAGLQ